VANLFLEGQEADGLLNATEGDVEGVEVFGLPEEATEADLHSHLLQSKASCWG